MKPLLLLLLLTSGVAYLSWSSRPSPVVPPGPITPRPEIQPRRPHQPGWFRELPPREKFATPWAALAAGDYPGFITLLREAGCPEETVRAFALAALGRTHQQRMEAPLREGIRNSKYWQPAFWEIPLVDSEPTDRRNRRAQTLLDRELSQLFGLPAAELRRAYRLRDDQGNSAIPGAGQPALAELLARHEVERTEQEATAFRGANGQLMDAAARKPLRELRERQRRELADLLGPEAAERYELRFSPEAYYVHYALPPAQNEDEFRRLVKAAQAVGVDSGDRSVDYQRQNSSDAPDSITSSPWEEIRARARETPAP